MLPRSEERPYLGYYPEAPGYFPGDIGFDPLGLRPDDPAELRAMQAQQTPTFYISQLKNDLR